MNEPVYPINYSPFDEIYSFTSIGRYGSIQKIVSFTEFQSNIFNLGFGDLDPYTDEINDTIVSDNGDMKMILATVLSILNEFLAQNPTAYIFFKGSTQSRTRLYQMAINSYFNEFNQVFEIYGLINDVPETFQKNKKYESFLIRKLL